jgi:hypothetical protein
VDVIDALNMTAPGYYAHLSSLKDGETLKIPQYSLNPDVHRTVPEPVAPQN